VSARAATTAGVIDAPGGAAYVLDGRVVTMDAAFRLIERGRVYVQAGEIIAVQHAQTAAPAGFATVPVIETRGTLFPGLIELHNHLSYNVLPLWQVPRIFAHRGQWSNHPDERRLISRPMSVLASVGNMIEAIVRYVEAKCLVGGVTTSQGLTLMAARGIARHYRGTVRNVEQTDDPALPEVVTRIPDVDNASQFLERLQASPGNSLLLHLAEGIGPQARKHFQALRIHGSRWAITRSLVGIHGAGLQDSDFDVFARKSAGLVWSPLSNLLLYGDTTDVRRAKQAGLRLALGSDWSPSGSKNLLSELKVAWAWSELRGGVFTPRELVAMSTIEPARMIGWDAALGSISRGKQADVLVVAGQSGDAYEHLLKAREDDVQLVLIRGVPRFGAANVMKQMRGLIEGAPVFESRTINGRPFQFNFHQASADPLVAPVTLGEAEQRLRRGLRDLPELASGLADPAIASATRGVVGAVGARGPALRWTLALDNEAHAPGRRHVETMRALTPWDARAAGEPFGANTEARDASTSVNLVPLELDALTVVDDEQYFGRLANAVGLRKELKTELPRMHGARVRKVPVAN
jgi:5-methylthioadenosine/S-adenosylhomocysteine deaminase